MSHICPKLLSESLQQTQHSTMFSHFTAKQAGHTDCFRPGFYDVRNELNRSKNAASGHTHSINCLDICVTQFCSSTVYIKITFVIMADTALAPAPPSPKKAVKKRAPAKPTAHPPFKDMVKSAIVALKERNGSSHQKITKYILANFKGLGDEAAAKRHIKMALKTGVSSGDLLQT